MFDILQARQRLRQFKTNEIWIPKNSLEERIVIRRARRIIKPILDNLIKRLKNPNSIVQNIILENAIFGLYSSPINLLKLLTANRDILPSDEVDRISLDIGLLHNFLKCSERHLVRAMIGSFIYTKEMQLPPLIPQSSHVSEHKRPRKVTKQTFRDKRPSPLLLENVPSYDHTKVMFDERKIHRINSKK